jgi:hypothetical protein
MHTLIELPDELWQEVLKHADVQQFIQRAIKKMLLEEKKQAQARQELLSLMAKFPSSVSLANVLIQDRRLEAKMEQQDNE